MLRPTPRSYRQQLLAGTQQFSFRPIKIDDAVKHLKYISEKEEIKISDDALRIIAERSDGSFRDSISLLDQLAMLAKNNQEEISVELIENMLGLTSGNTVDLIIQAVEQHNLADTVGLINNAFDNGASYENFS